MNLKGSKTEVNLMQAFAGESQARNRYTYYASVAKDEGFMQIAAIFEETANQEKEHAKRLFKFMEGGEVTITNSFPAGKLHTTRENLLAAAAGEHHGHTEMYPDFAKIARDEGFPAIAKAFEAIAVAEKFHEERYQAMAKNIADNKVFNKGNEHDWTCRNCGYQHHGVEAPSVCPACAHKQAHFEITARNW